jgi:Uncharacterised nucleotidyltransferase
MNGAARQCDSRYTHPAHHRRLVNNDESDLPPLGVVQGALRKVTERLANELAKPNDVAPDWSELEWQLARAVAAMHGVSPLLATHLKWEGPPGWKPFLLAQRVHVASRHRRIEELLSQLDARSREEDISLVGLKGAALHGLGLYRAGERPMADVDLLVHPKQAQRAGDVLESLGFAQAYANWKHKVFMPEVHDTHAQIGEHAQNYLKIELHERIAEILPLRVRDVTASVYPLSPHPGLNAYPSRAALLIHLLIHAASAMAYRALRLLHLHDIALVSARMSNADWDELLALGRNADGPWWALPPLQLTARYYGAAIPTPVLDALAEHCQWHLRRIARRQSISDVSLSSLWIEAFPGIGWSRSASEVMEYVGSRLWPGKETLQLRKVLAQTEVPASQSAWSHSTQGQRILRWLMSRQVRPDTMHAVRMALALPQ